MSIDIEENKSSIKSRYRPEIDGLRAFAVVAVIINHFNKEILPNGYLGVDIFFVISGFVITSSLYQRPSKNFKDFISGFYELDLMEYSEVSAKEEGLSWSGKIKKLLREDRDKKRELAEMRQSIYGASL